VSEHRLVILSINSEGLALQDIILGGGIRLNYNVFKAKSLNAIFLAKKGVTKVPCAPLGLIS
jgi:hypothetical protein